jgi:hypothetical protein
MITFVNRKAGFSYFSSKITFTTWNQFSYIPYSLKKLVTEYLSVRKRGSSPKILHRISVQFNVGGFVL